MRRRDTKFWCQSDGQEVKKSLIYMALAVRSMKTDSLSYEETANIIFIRVENRYNTLISIQWTRREEKRNSNSSGNSVNVWRRFHYKHKLSIITCSGRSYRKGWGHRNKVEEQINGNLGKDAMDDFFTHKTTWSPWYFLLFVSVCEMSFRFLLSFHFCLFSFKILPILIFFHFPYFLIMMTQQLTLNWRLYRDLETDAHPRTCTHMHVYLTLHILSICKMNIWNKQNQFYVLFWIWKSQIKSFYPNLKI